MTFDWEYQGRRYRLVFSKWMLKPHPGIPADVHNCAFLIFEK